MLHILLLVLKIIGIVLLCILGMLILGTACALFVPVRYQIEAVRKEGKGEPPVAITVKITWLLHFMNVLVRFSGSLSVRARLMVFTVFRLPKREKRCGAGQDDAENRKTRKRQKKEKQPKSREPGEQGRENRKTEGTKTEETRAERRKTEETGAEEAKADKETIPGDAVRGETEDAQAADGEKSADLDKKPTWMDKLRAIPEIIRSIFAKIKGFFENIQYTIQNICDKIRSVSDTIEYYREVIAGETFQRSFALCKGELLTIARSLKPKRFEATLVVGTDDPALTGEILAVCGMLYPILGPKVNVAGDFEKKRLEGRVFVKGKLRLFTFIRAAVRIYFNKEIRKLYGLLKKEAV